MVGNKPQVSIQLPRCFTLRIPPPFAAAYQYRQLLPRIHAQPLRPPGIGFVLHDQAWCRTRRPRDAIPFPDIPFLPILALFAWPGSQ
jgi:hypothetical protein